MSERWRVLWGVGAIALGFVLCILRLPQFGVWFVLLGIYLCVRGAVGGRRGRQERRSVGALEEHRNDLGERLDRGETLDEVAVEYDRLYKIPPTRTLIYGAALIRAIVGSGRDREKNDAAKTVLDRQAVVSPEAADREIERFSSASNVFFVDAAANFYPELSKPDEGERGVFIIARHFSYFFADANRASPQEEFARGLAKEKVFDWIGVPYLSEASAVVELVGSLREELQESFKPEVIERLKKLFHEPGSFAVAHSTIVALDRLPLETRLGLPRERLVIVTEDGAGHESRYCFGSSRVFDERWTTGVTELLKTVGVLNGRLLVY